MKSLIFICLLVSILCGAGYFYYTSTTNTISKLTSENSTLIANNSNLINANEENLNTIDNLQEEFKRVEEDFQRTQSEFQVIREQNNELRERLGEHELDALAAAKPELVERIINNASDNALRCFELLSGAPLNEREKNAETERQFNSECPWLYYNFISR